MKITATLATMVVIMTLTACASAPSDATASSPAPAAVSTASRPASAAAPTASNPPAAPTTQTAARPAPASPSDQVVTTAKTTRVCKTDDSTGSRLKRPKCVEVPEGSEKEYREQLLRENTDELRQLNEANTLRGTSDVFSK